MPPKRTNKKQTTEPTNTPNKNQKKTSPVWRGPEEDGITQSLLQKFLVCPYRFYLLAVKGLVPNSPFNHAIEFGQLWHEGEEALARGTNPQHAINKYHNYLVKTYDDKKEVDKWAWLAKKVFPIYKEFWKTHETNRVTYTKREEAFAIPYPLPSGRVVTLRGKWDGVFINGNRAWLQENKTKGTIDQGALQATINYDLQTMLYLTALFPPNRKPQPLEPKLGGVLYNVIRRPLSSRNSPRQKKSETLSQYLQRAVDQIKENPAQHFFRWQIRITLAELKQFQLQTLNPILENLCNWWEWIQTHPNPYSPTPYNPPKQKYRGTKAPTTYTNPKQNYYHYRLPYGIYNPLWDGRRDEYFDLLTKGNSYGYKQITNLFPELEEN